MGSSRGASFIILNLAWIYKISTAARFAKPREEDKSVLQTALYFIVAPLGIMVPVYLMGMLGLISQITAGNWNLPAVTFHVFSSLISIIITIAALGASLAIFHTNAMNLYPAVADLLTTLQPVFKNKKA